MGERVWFLHFIHEGNFDNVYPFRSSVAAMEFYEDSINGDVIWNDDSGILCPNGNADVMVYPMRVRD